jgi:hypothetical protein
MASWDAVKLAKQGNAVNQVSTCIEEWLRLNQGC